MKKGRLTAYKKKDESMSEAAKRAMGSDDPSVKKMGALYFTLRKMSKKKKSKKD